jgi:molybdenum cofactor biosynthesis enzyme MoaA
MTRKNFCLYPFAAFSLDNAGRQRICCNNQGYDRLEKNKEFNDPTFEVLESFNNDFHKEIRKYFIEDKKHPTCKKCWEIESNGKISWRQWFNESFGVSMDEDYWISKCDADGTIKEAEFYYLDITFGNRCNLKCVMCNGFNSTLFLKEQLDTKQIPIEHYDRMMKLDWYHDGSCLEKLYPFVSKVERIHIVGGEPLIIDHQAFLQKFIDLGISKNIVLSYNSNLTKTPREILDCWKEFKRVYLCVSVDAYGKLNEFIRYPMKWNKLIDNLETIDTVAKEQENISIQIHATFSSLNCDRIIEFLDWHKEISTQLTSIEPHPMFNYVYNPKYFDPTHLPQETKNKIYEDYIKWESNNLEYLERNGTRERIDMLKSYIEKMIKSGRNEKLYREGVDKIAFFEKVRDITFPTKTES